MGDVSDPNRVLLVIAVVSRHGQPSNGLVKPLRRSLAHCPYGAAFDFTETDYYAATMGAGVKKQFIAFDVPIDPAGLAEIKRTTNQWEADYAGSSHAEHGR